MKTISQQLAWQRIHSSMAEQSTLLSSTTSSGSRLTVKLCKLRYCKTNDMIVDMLTKGLSGEQFEKLKFMAGVSPTIKHSESIEKEC